MSQKTIPLKKKRPLLFILGIKITLIIIALIIEYNIIETYTTIRLVLFSLVAIATIFIIEIIVDLIFSSLFYILIIIGIIYLIR